MNIVIPMAGAGKRFLDEYALPKPLIPIDGKPMVVQATAWLPPCNHLVFVALDEHLDNYPLEAALVEAYPHAEIVVQKGMLPGQACSSELGVRGGNLDLNESVLFSSCDYDTVCDLAGFQRVVDDDPDVIIWTFRHTPCSRDNPKAYGWIDTARDGLGPVYRICPKAPISEAPWEDHAETGTFWFRTAQLFLDGLKVIYEKKTKTNNEYYTANLVSELIAAGANVRVFEVDRFMCWGTPNDLYDYEYWKGYFDRR